MIEIELSGNVAAGKSPSLGFVGKASDLALVLSRGFRYTSGTKP